MTGQGGGHEEHRGAGRGVLVQSAALLDEEQVCETHEHEFGLAGVADPGGGREGHIVAGRGVLVQSGDHLDKEPVREAHAPGRVLS